MALSDTVYDVDYGRFIVSDTAPENPYDDLMWVDTAGGNPGTWKRWNEDAQEWQASTVVGSAQWGAITGTLSDQTDLWAVLPSADQKAAMDAAATPNAGNAFATMADVGGGGDMDAATYDPQGISGDAFARANHTGTDPADEVSVAATPTNYTAAQPNAEAHLAGIDAALGSVGGGAVDSVDGRTGVVTLGDLYDTKGDAATVQGNLDTHVSSPHPTADQEAAMDAATSPSGGNPFATQSDIASAGGGDVSGPASAADGNLAVFSGTTGKIIRDGGPPSAGGGDMEASTYDPQGIAGDAFARANHTGTQAGTTVTVTGPFDGNLSGAPPADVDALAQAVDDLDLSGDPAPVTSVDGRTGVVTLSDLYDTNGAAATVQGNLDAHTGDQTNPHVVTADQVGLGNVDNTADADKPVSTAQQAALDLKLNLTGGTLAGDLVMGSDGSTPKILWPDGDVDTHDITLPDDLLALYGGVTDNADDIAQLQIDVESGQTPQRWVRTSGSGYSIVGDLDSVQEYNASPLDLESAEVDTEGAVDLTANTVTVTADMVVNGVFRWAVVFTPGSYSTSNGSFALCNGDPVNGVILQEVTWNTQAGADLLVPPGTTGSTGVFTLATDLLSAGDVLAVYPMVVGNSKTVTINSYLIDVSKADAVGIGEAPVDGTPYSRQDAGWVSASGGSVTETDPIFGASPAAGLTGQATQGQMEAGTETDLLTMSPLRVAQAIAALGGGGGGFTWNIVTAAPTSGNVAPDAGDWVRVDLSGATASPNFVLPTCSLGDDPIAVEITATSADHELVLIGAAGVSVGGSAAATEWSRVWIKPTDKQGETVTFECIATNTWAVKVDERIASRVRMQLTTSASGEAPVAWVAPTSKGGVFTAYSEVGDIATESTSSIYPRRGGAYLISVIANPASVVPVGKYFQGGVYINGTLAIIASSVSPSSGAQQKATEPAAVRDLTAGQQVQYQYRSQEGSIGLSGLTTINASGISLLEILS